MYNKKRRRPLQKKNPRGRYKKIKILQEKKYITKKNIKKRGGEP